MTAFATTLEFLRLRKAGYQRTFNEEAIADIMRFCRMYETCFVPGDRDKTMMLEGRREVALRIFQHMKLSPEQLASIYATRIPTGDQNG